MEEQTVRLQRIANSIQEFYEHVEEEKKQSLEESSQLHLLLHQALQLERDRLINKHGQDHSRVKKVEKRQSYYSELVPILQQEEEWSKIKVPKFEGGWYVHGVLVDEEVRPIKGITLSLFDHGGKWIEELGYASTDDRGYYALIVPKEATDLVEKYQNTELFLTASDRTQEVLKTFSEPIFLNPGEIQYRDLFLTQEERATPPPPSGSKGKHIPHPKFTLFKGMNNQFYFNLTAEDGEIILQSEGYKRKSGALNGIKSVRTNARIEARFERLVAQNKQLYFTLKAENGQVIGTSQMFNSNEELEKDIEMVGSVAPVAALEER